MSFAIDAGTPRSSSDGRVGGTTNDPLGLTAMAGLRTPLSSLCWTTATNNSNSNSDNGHDAEQRTSNHYYHNHNMPWWTPSPSLETRDFVLCEANLCGERNATKALFGPDIQDIDNEYVPFDPMRPYIYDVEPDEKPTALPFLPECDDYDYELENRNMEQSNENYSELAVGIIHRRPPRYLPRPCFSPDILTLPLDTVVGPLPPPSMQRRIDRMVAIEAAMHDNHPPRSPSHEEPHESVLEESRPIESELQQRSLPPQLPLMATPELADRNAHDCGLQLPLASLAMRRE